MTFGAESAGQPFWMRDGPCPSVCFSPNASRWRIADALTRGTQQAVGGCVEQRSWTSAAAVVRSHKPTHHAATRARIRQGRGVTPPAHEAQEAHPPGNNNSVERRANCLPGKRPPMRLVRSWLRPGLRGHLGRRSQHPRRAARRAPVQEAVPRKEKIEQTDAAAEDLESAAPRGSFAMAAPRSAVGSRPGREAGHGCPCLSAAPVGRMLHLKPCAQRVSYKR